MKQDLGTTYGWTKFQAVPAKQDLGTSEGLFWKFKTGIPILFIQGSSQGESMWFFWGEGVLFQLIVSDKWLLEVVVLVMKTGNLEHQTKCDSPNIWFAWWPKYRCMCGQLWEQNSYLQLVVEAAT